MSGYRESALDKKLRKRFQNNHTVQSLRGIYIYRGSIRGLARGFYAKYNFPIVAICGANGTGKSTLMALTACAFHNKSNGYNPKNRKNPWYEFSSFFLRSIEDAKLEGVGIRYSISHNKWKPTKRSPSKEGVKTQARWKRIGGRWNNYSKRIDRNTLVLGVDRVVPEYEKSVLRSYQSYFEHRSDAGWEANVIDDVGYVLGIDYDSLSYYEHAGHRLPVVSRDGRKYSGFHMGAGESALFELFSSIYGCKSSLMLVVDEIELGLHPEAQSRLILRLKEILAKRKLQIVCTTHSSHVLDSLPPDARIFLQRVGSGVEVIEGISSALATGLLSGNPSGELDILVEDEVAHAVLRLALTSQQRRRVNILPVGSYSAVVRHFAMRYIEGRSTVTIAVFDGDQRKQKSELLSIFKKSFEDKSIGTMHVESFEKRLFFLPGSDWPERWLVDQMKESAFESFDERFGIDATEREECRKVAMRAGKHNESHAIAQRLSLDKDTVRDALVDCALKAQPDERSTIQDIVEAFLG